ncbi:LPS-assembly lipoprotein LptE [Glaciimonas sp. GNP009]|uniref:LPS-assembly lipoprotein LptE n=1 Tax=Glaciimonas sp. CA11.2 TaxID=3048601 RepID=UPI002AB42B3D|nr:LPS assembly lipoprotein LptE [Glaciimonas sp. CA11.2]MDY7545602.1 LPS assembly lipoprotein LptE [Glaciimonas sp. CA11.2]
MTRVFMSRQPLVRWSIIIALTAMLAACGFHLRGTANLPFKTIYLGSATGTPLGVELKRNIQASGTTEVVPNEKGAEAVMEVISQTQEKVILTLNSQGRAREYMLYSRFSFRLKDAQQKELMPQTLITLKRDISYNESQELSKVAEEALLYRDMQTDLVQQILRRMNALKPANTANNTVIEPSTATSPTTSPAPSVPSTKPAP